MTYKLTIKISSDLEAMGESRGGFALQATGGKIVITNKKDTQYIEKFLTHTLEGSKSRSWSFSWQAPKTGDEVTLTVMAIASNGDYSAVGDLIGAQSYAIKALKK
ncbi:MAG TPA: hypothetical protein HPP56_06045 [Nitrospirae bacterium]|nr:hypothetical protein [Nitrospirota bacterium]